MIRILSNQSFVKKIFIEVLENDFPNWVLVLFGVCELGHILSPFLSRNGLVWLVLVSTHSQHKIFIFSVNAKLSITQFTMSIQDLHSLLIPGKTSTHLIQKPFIFIFRPFLFWHFAVSTKDCNFSNQSCEYFINLLQLKS